MRDNLAKLRGVTVTDDALDELIALADQFLPNRSFPDKGVDLIEQSVAYALTHGQTTVDVAARPGRRRGAHRHAARSDAPPSRRWRPSCDDRALLEPAAAGRAARRGSASRCAASTRGRERPDAVVLLCDGAAAGAGSARHNARRGVCSAARPAVIDIDLVGHDRRLVDLDAARARRPGSVGSDRPLPLHELRRSPVAGRRCCAASTPAPSPIRDTIAAALAAGSFTDAMGRRIPLGRRDRGADRPGRRHERRRPGGGAAGGAPRARA